MNTDLFSVALANLIRQAGGMPANVHATARLQRLERDEGSAIDWLETAASLLPAAPSMALAVLERGLVRWPEDIALRYLRGTALRLGGRADAAEEALRDVIRRMPQHVDASVSLAHLLREQGRMNALADVIVALWRATPRSTGGDLRTLSFLRECGRHADAADLLGPILATHPRDVRLHLVAGEILLALGRFDEARSELAAASAGNADLSAAWLRLAHTHRFAERTDPDLLALEAAAKRSDLSADTRTCIDFALGKAHDDLGDTDEAATCLARANGGWRARHAWSAQHWQRLVEQREGSRLADSSRTLEAGITPVFIVGLPRTGTTLVANLLGRDARVRNRGELNWIAKLSSRLRPDPSASALDAAARLYLMHLRQDDAPAPFCIDKNPLNFRDLDLIAAMLPNARIVHCRRDLPDTALSLWSAHFMHEEMAWSYAFEDIGAYAEGHARLMRHWRARCTLPMLEIDYETLVADPEAGIARLRGFLGLSGETPTPATAAAPDAITTASVWQARQQVHAGSVGRWRRYAAHVPALAGLAGAAGAALSRPA